MHKVVPHPGSKAFRGAVASSEADVASHRRPFFQDLVRLYRPDSVREGAYGSSLGVNAIKGFLQVKEPVVR